MKARSATIDRKTGLLACLDSLGAGKREVVVLAYPRGDVGSTNRPIATVKTWLRRYRAQIKDSLVND